MVAQNMSDPLAASKLVRSRHNDQERPSKKPKLELPAPHRSIPDHKRELDSSTAKVTSIEDDTYDQDQEGRFFGDGLSRDQAQAIEYLERQDAGPDEASSQVLDLGRMRKMAARFEKAITKNQGLRTRYGDDPIKFLDSEVELDNEIKGLSALAEHPELYRDFCEMGCLSSLISLLAHENSDIACDTIQVLVDLTDEDSIADQEQHVLLINHLAQAGTFRALIDNLKRMDESNEIDKNGIHGTLTIFENVIAIDNTRKVELYQASQLGAWCLSRLGQPDEEVISMNKQYAVELLDLMLSGENSNIQDFIDGGGVDICLVALAKFRRRVPTTGTEEEYFANLCDVMCTICDRAAGKDQMIADEGIELLQRILLDNKSSGVKRNVVQVLSHASNSWSGGVICAHIIQAGLLDDISSMLKHSRNPDLVRNLLSIVVSFFRTLLPDETDRPQVVRKFMVKDFQLSQKLLDLRAQSTARLATFSATTKFSSELTNSEDKLALEFTTYLDRLEHGLEELQYIDIILAWLYCSDEIYVNYITRQPNILSEIKTTLVELRDNLSPKSKMESARSLQEGRRNGDEDGDGDDIEEEVQLEIEMIEALMDEINGR